MIRNYIKVCLSTQPFSLIKFLLPLKCYLPGASDWLTHTAFAFRKNFKTCAFRQMVHPRECQCRSHQARDSDRSDFFFPVNGIGRFFFTHEPIPLQFECDWKHRVRLPKHDKAPYWLPASDHRECTIFIEMCFCHCKDALNVTCVDGIRNLFQRRCRDNCYRTDTSRVDF